MDYGSRAQSLSLSLSLSLVPASEDGPSDSQQPIATASLTGSLPDKILREAATGYFLFRVKQLSKIGDGLLAIVYFVPNAASVIPTSYSRFSPVEASSPRTPSSDSIINSTAFNGTLGIWLGGS
jgi:hypothetical protein